MRKGVKGIFRLIMPFSGTTNFDFAVNDDAQIIPNVRNKNDLPRSEFSTEPNRLSFGILRKA
jgi:hypothetical protein